jgi:hypothetical protein
MFRLLALSVCLATLSSAEEALPDLPRVYSNETSLGLVLGHDLSEVGYVAAHCEALDRYLRQVLFMPALPPPKARVEILDTAKVAQVTARNFGGEAFVQVQLGEAVDPTKIAAEVAAQAWLARVALAGGKPVDVAPRWVSVALMAELQAMLRPALVDLWYRDGRLNAPNTLENILAGRATEGEVFLFWRTMRAELGSSPEQVKALIAAAQGGDIAQCLPKPKMLSEGSWQLARANLLLTRNPVSLGMRESAESLDDMAHFVFDLGEGDIVLKGPQAVTHREAPGIKSAMEARLAALRREILRQNPVYHNAWRAFGAWLENFSSAKPEELQKLWDDFLKEREAAAALRREADEVLLKASAQ